MPIQVSCRCGKKYRVPDSASGRHFKCKHCDVRIDVPVQAILVPTPPTATPDIIDPRMLTELNRIRVATSSAASNPGMLPMSRFRHVMAFPVWAAIWHVPIVAFALLSILHLAFIPPAILFSAGAYLYWRRIRFKFIGGCANPGMVLSLLPPRIAVLTNLKKQPGSDWNVIKVMSHPLRRMSTGRPSIGQRVVAIADYAGSGAGDPRSHWIDFYPVVADIVCTHREHLQRLLSTFSDEDWKELADGLRQLPGPKLEDRIYRIYDFGSLPKYIPMPLAQVSRLIDSLFASCWPIELASKGLNPELVQKASSYVAAHDMPSIIAICESIQRSEGPSGFALTATHLYFSYKETGRGQMAYSEMAGALTTVAGIEITTRVGARLFIPDRHFLRQSTVSLEAFVTELTDG